MYLEQNEKLEKFVTVIICLVGLIMLIVPLWILTYVKGMKERLGIITGCLVLFLLLIQGVSIARPFETLAATAA